MQGKLCHVKGKCKCGIGRMITEYAIWKVKGCRTIPMVKNKILSFEKPTIRKLFQITLNPTIQLQRGQQFESAYWKIMLKPTD